jgi:hypothetical protein
MKIYLRGAPRKAQPCSIETVERDIVRLMEFEQEFGECALSDAARSAGLRLRSRLNAEIASIRALRASGSREHVVSQIQASYARITLALADITTNELHCPLIPPEAYAMTPVALIAAARLLARVK